MNFLIHSVSLAENTLLMMSDCLIYVPPVQHSDRPSEIYYFIPGSSHIFDKCFSLIVCYIIIFNENITGFNNLKKIYSGLK